MPTVCITNQKGGCGKTVTATNLAAGLARKGLLVLLVDLDPQGPVAPGLGVSPSEEMLPIAEALRKKRLHEIALPTRDPNLIVVPGDVSLDHQALSGEPLRDTVLERALVGLREQFDYVLLDTPPNLDLVTLNAIMASDWLIVPCDVDRESLSSLNRTLEVAFQYVEYRPEVVPEQFFRVLVTIYDPRDQVMNAWLDKQLLSLPTPPFEVRIRRSTALKKARASGLSIFEYRDKNPTGARGAAQDFERLTQEVIAYEHERTDPDHRLAANDAV